MKKWYQNLKIGDKITLIKPIYEDYRDNVFADPDHIDYSKLLGIKNLEVGEQYKIILVAGNFIIITSTFNNWQTNTEIQYKYIEYFEPELKTKLKILTNEI